MPQRNGGLGTALREAEAQSCPGNSTGCTLVCPSCQCCSQAPALGPPDPVEQLRQHHARLGLGTEFNWAEIKHFPLGQILGLSHSFANPPTADAHPKFHFPWNHPTFEQAPIPPPW